MKKNRIYISKEIEIISTWWKKNNFKTFILNLLLIQFSAYDTYVIEKTATKFMSNNSQSRGVKKGLGTQ